MKYLNKTIACGLYLLVFLLPLQSRWIIKAGQLNNGPWEYGTYSLYGIDVLLIIILALYFVYRVFNIPNNQFPMTNDQTNSKFKIQNYLILGLVLASAVSVLFAADKPLALYKFGWLALGLGLFWLVTSANYDRIKLIYALLAGAFLSAGLGVWQFLGQATFANKWLGLALHRGADLGASVIEAVGADGIGERWLRAYGSLDHPNILGGMLAVVILLLVGQIIISKRVDNFQFSPLRQAFGGQAIFNFQTIFNDKIFKFINWLLLIVFTAALFFSFSRSAWLALAMGLAVTIVSAAATGNLKSQKGLAETILAMGILLLVLFYQYGNLATARLGGEGRLEVKSNFERLASYQEAWQLIKNNWLFGAGLGNYTLVNYNAKIKLCETAKRRNCEKISSYDYRPAHNAFMLVWAESGIFGIIFFIGLLFVMARSVIVLSFWRELERPIESHGVEEEMLSLRSAPLQHDRKDCHYSSQELVILVALIVLMSFDHWLWSLHFGVLFFWLVIGLIARNSQLASRNS